MSYNKSYRYYGPEEVRDAATCLVIAGILTITSFFVYNPGGSWIERILDYQEVVGSFWRVLLLLFLILAGGICGYVGKRAYGWSKLLVYGGLIAVSIALLRVLMPFIVATAILIIGTALLLSNSSGPVGTTYNRRRGY